MPAWKKIAALFTLSAAAGIHGAACTAEVPETSERAEATVAAETADDVSVDAFGGPGLARSRCQNRCRDNYALCGRGRLFGRSPMERERRCRDMLNGCLVSCRRF